MTALAGAPKESFLAHVRDGDVGGVILVGRWSSSAQMAQASRTLQAAACERGTPLLLAVDQEGGPMRRLPWAAPAESARSLGTRGAAHAETEARATAAALHRAGIDVDFAPVADTELAPQSFLGSRTFSSDPSLVARLAAAFVRGLQLDHVAATAKHFPGLGAATANTDDHVVSVRRVRLQPFRSAIAAGVQLVMVSNASYPGLGPFGAPGRLLAGDRHRPSPRQARIRRRRRDGCARCSHAGRDAARAGAGDRRRRRPPALHLGVGRPARLREPAAGRADEPPAPAADRRGGGADPGAEELAREELLGGLSPS